MDLQKIKTTVLHSNDINDLHKAQVELNEMICTSDHNENRAEIGLYTTLYGICRKRISLLKSRAFIRNRIIVERARFFLPDRVFNQMKRLAKNI